MKVGRVRNGPIVSWMGKIYLMPLALATFTFSTMNFVYAQADIPIGSWRIHTSFNAINSIASSEKSFFGAAGNGIMVMDRSDNSISSYSKLSGLSGTTISSLNYDQITKVLLIGYKDGRFDVINENNEVISFDPTANASFTGSKKINHIYVYDTKAYLATDYGVVVFDLPRQQIKETWRDLGKVGETLSINQCIVVQDSIFLATGNGVIAGNLTSNLLDFNNWKRFDTGVFNSPVESLAVFNGAIYATINNSGIHFYKDGIWGIKEYLQGLSFHDMHASSSKLLIAETDRLWEVSVFDELIEIVSPLIEEPRAIYSDENSRVWIGDGKNGMVSDISGSFMNFLPNSPSNEKITSLDYDQGTVYALGGGYSDSGLALGNNGITDKFSEGIWSPELSSLSDLTDIAFNPHTKKVYRSSFGFGIEEKDEQGMARFFDQSNSPLISTIPGPGFVNITSLEHSSDGLWVGNYGAEQSLHLFKDDNTWESFSFPVVVSQYPIDMVTDLNGSVWMALHSTKGGGIFVFNKNNNESTYLTDVSGSGGLPAKPVHSMAVDRDGMVWVGTDQGVAFYIDPSDVFSPGIDAIKPIFENRFLLRDDKVTAIAIDGGNRKWLGTERGVWLFNSTGEKLIYNFTSQNSPLLSNVILDIEVNDKTGEVFFATDEGLVSFRSDATESSSLFQSVKVFPNPVTSTFSGAVGISGLATDAVVKITDVSGKLVWQAQANGGTATWNVMDYNGRRVGTGVYLVFSATQDGGESVVAKIAVVD